MTVAKDSAELAEKLLSPQQKRWNDGNYSNWVYSLLNKYIVLEVELTAMSVIGVVSFGNGEAVIDVY